MSTVKCERHFANCCLCFSFPFLPRQQNHWLFKFSTRWTHCCHTPDSVKALKTVKAARHSYRTETCNDIKINTTVFNFTHGKEKSFKHVLIFNDKLLHFVRKRPKMTSLMIQDCYHLSDQIVTAAVTTITSVSACVNSLC